SRDTQPEPPIGEQHEGQLRGHALNRALQHQGPAPGSAQGDRDQGGERLGVEGGSRFADDQPTQYAGDEPHAVQDRPGGHGDGVGRAVPQYAPGPEVDAKGGGDHRGDDDVDGAPSSAGVHEYLPALVEPGEDARHDRAVVMARLSMPELPTLALPRSG